FAYDLAELLDDDLRRAARRANVVDGRGIEALQGRSDGGDVRNNGIRFGRGHAQGPHCTGLDMRQVDTQGVDGHFNPSADDVRRGNRRATIRNVDDVDFRHL